MKNRLSLRLVLGVSAMLLVGLAIPASAKGLGNPSNPCPGVNVASIIADIDVNSNPFQFQSDGLGAYLSYNQSKTDQVASVIQSNSCDWLLDTSNSASRTEAFTFAATN